MNVFLTEAGSDKNKIILCLFFIHFTPALLLCTVATSERGKCTFIFIPVIFKYTPLAMPTQNSHGSRKIVDALPIFYLKEPVTRLIICKNLQTFAIQTRCTFFKERTCFTIFSLQLRWGNSKGKKVQLHLQRLPFLSFTKFMNLSGCNRTENVHKNSV